MKIQEICFKQIKNKELLKKLNLDSLLSEFLVWNSLDSLKVSFKLTNYIGKLREDTS